jgi:hypothetical protein
MKPLFNLSEEEQVKMQEEIKKLNEKLDQVSKTLDEFISKFNEPKKLDEEVKEEVVEEKVEEVILEKEVEVKDEDVKINEFNQLLNDGRVCEAQRKFYLSNDWKGFAENAQELHLNSIGHSQDFKICEDAEEEIIRLANENMKNKNISLSKSISEILLQNKELAKKYNDKFHN